MIGVGNMGLGIALNLLGKGYAVSVRDIDAAREAMAAKAGAQMVATPAALAAQSEVIIIAVVSAQQTQRVLCDEQGVLHAAHKPSCVMLCPTIAPEDVERLAKLLAQQGIAAIDAPMSGGPVRAREGSMSLMVACDDSVYAQHEALLHDMASPVFRISRRIGDGARTKLVNNLLASINLAGAAQCLALAERMGLDLSATLAVMEQSSAQSWIGSDRMRRALAGQTKALAHMSLLAKDSALAMQAASAVQMPTSLGEEAAALFRAACDAGYADADDGAMLQWMRKPCL
jgi:L-threonate 2-dehydrogenase